MNEWMDGWLDGWVTDWLAGWMNVNWMSFTSSRINVRNDFIKMIWENTFSFYAIIIIIIIFELYFVYGHYKFS